MCASRIQVPLEQKDLQTVVDKYKKKHKSLWKHLQTLSNFQQQQIRRLFEDNMLNYWTSAYDWSLVALKSLPKRTKGTEIESLQLVVQREGRPWLYAPPATAYYGRPTRPQTGGLPPHQPFDGEYFAAQDHEQPQAQPRGPAPGVFPGPPHGPPFGPAPGASSRPPHDPHNPTPRGPSGPASGPPPPPAHMPNAPQSSPWRQLQGPPGPFDSVPEEMLKLSSSLQKQRQIEAALSQESYPYPFKSSAPARLSKLSKTDRVSSINPKSMLTLSPKFQKGSGTSSSSLDSFHPPDSNESEIDYSSKKRTYRILEPTREHKRREVMQDLRKNKRHTRKLLSKGEIEHTQSSRVNMEPGLSIDHLVKNGLLCKEKGIGQCCVRPVRRHVRKSSVEQISIVSSMVILLERLNTPMSTLDVFVVLVNLYSFIQQLNPTGPYSHPNRGHNEESRRSLH